MLSLNEVHFITSRTSLLRSAFTFSVHLLLEKKHIYVFVCFYMYYQIYTVLLIYNKNHIMYKDITILSFSKVEDELRASIKEPDVFASSIADSAFMAYCAHLIHMDAASVHTLDSNQVSVLTMLIFV